MPYKFQVGFPSELVITTVVLNNSINIKLTPFATANGLTFYHCYSDEMLPTSLEVKFLPIFNGCQFFARFYPVDSVNYRHRYEKFDNDHLVPEDDNFNFYMFKNYPKLVNSTIFNQFIIKYSAINCYTTIVEYRVNRVVVN